MARQTTNHLTRELAHYRSAELIEDGVKSIISCSSCGEELIEIWVVRPNAPLKTSLVVECPLCNDQSFTKEIKGQYCLGQIESKKVIMTDTPTKVNTDDSGQLLQEVRVKTTKGEE